MHTRVPWWLLSLGAVLFLVIGIILACSVKNWPLLTLKYEVDVFSAFTAVLSLLITLLLAYWVTIVLENQNMNNRAQKEIIIKHMEHLYTITEELREKIRTGQINHSLTTSNLKRIYVNTAAIQLCLTKNSIVVEENHEQLIQVVHAELKNLLTNPVANDPDLSVANGNIIISENRRVLIDTELDKLKNEIFLFELAVNRG